MPKALEGLKVLDLTQWEAGPSCTEYLAFLGADVVKIEPPGRGEPARKAGLSKAEREKGYNDSWYFILFNASKQGITLDLKSEKGTAIFKEMVKKADVVVSNFLPGTMEKLGIGYEVLRNINPGLVYAENSGFGKGGPYSAYPCFDAIAKAVGSAFSNTGTADGPPLNPGPSIGDTGAGVHMAVAILAALRYRDRTGAGQQIDMAMTDNIINLNRIHFRRSIGIGEPQPRAGGGSAETCPWDTFRCKGDKPNDYIFIGAPMAHQYEALMKLVGREDLVEGLKDDSEARWQKQAVINEAIETWTKTKDKMEAFHTLAKAGIPAGPVLDTLEVLNDPHFTQRGIVIEMHHQERGRHKMISCPVKMSCSTPEYTPAPSLGQHNEEVYTEWMDYTKEDIARLKEEQVI